MAFTGSGFFFFSDSRFARACRPGARLIYRIYFAPGMFGFGRLGSYDYFAHVERAITERLRAVGHDAYTYVLDVPPTASIRRRAAALTELVACTADEGDGRDGPIHLVGHSTGGLD